MITKLFWQWILILPGGSGSSHRVARRVLAGENPFLVYDFGRGTNLLSWSQTAPPSIPHDGKTYAFAFWAVSGRDAANPHTDIRPDTGEYLVIPDDPAGRWQYTVRAYYVWDFDSGPGPHGVQIDAVDQDAFSLGEADLAAGFLAEDFVTVTPDDPTGTLTREGNDGWIGTSPIPEGLGQITITAASNLPEGQFQTWWRVTSPGTPLGSPSPVGTRPAVGQPPANYDQIIVQTGDIVYALAFYARGKPMTIGLHSVLPQLTIGITDTGVTIIHVGGGGDPGPIGRMLREPMVALVELADASSRVSPALRANVLKLAVEQLSLISAMLQGEIEKLQG